MPETLGIIATVLPQTSDLLQRFLGAVRRTLSFSKDKHWHELHIRLFIDHYNRELERTGYLASV